MTKMMMKFGVTPNLPFGLGALPTSLQSGLGTVNSSQISAGSMMQLATKGADQVPQGLAGSQPLQIGSAFENTALRGKVTDSTYGSRTEKVLSNFLQNPVLKGEGEGHDEMVCTYLTYSNWMLCLFYLPLHPITVDKIIITFPIIIHTCVR